MRPGCPVGFDDLRYLTVSYWGFDDAAHQGEIVVNRVVADDVIDVFRRLYEARYPIWKMSLVDDYGPGRTRLDGADDFGSIEANNTSAFNCRLRTGSTSQFSEHSFGWAVDINPLINPYVSAKGATAHPGSRRYLDRSVTDRGVIHGGDVVVAAFSSVGWEWGGTWSGARDYQHFSRSGR